MEEEVVVVETEESVPSYMYMKLVSGDTIIGLVGDEAEVKEDLEVGAIRMTQIMTIKSFSAPHPTEEGFAVETISFFTSWLQPTDIMADVFIPTDTIVVITKPGPLVVEKYKEAFSRELNAASMSILKNTINRLAKEEGASDKKTLDEKAFVALPIDEKKPEMVTPDVIQEADRMGEFPDVEEIDAPYKVNGKTVH